MACVMNFLMCCYDVVLGSSFPVICISQGRSSSSWGSAVNSWKYVLGYILSFPFIKFSY